MRLLLIGACLAAGQCSAFGACLPDGALGAPSVSLRAAFSPEILGRSTTLRLSVQIRPTTELVPPPLLEGELRYPAGLDVQLSGLGIAACSAATLELSGPQGCPPDSLMGYGSAIAALVIKHKVVREAAQIAIVRSAEQDGHPALMFYVYDETALNAQIVLPAELLPASRPYGGLLYIHVPLVPTFPEGPDVSVSELRLVLGPKNLTYYEHVHHRTLRYKPAGIPLLGRCPRGGFPFTIELTFLGGGRADGATAVPCPARPVHTAATSRIPARRHRLFR